MSDEKEIPADVTEVATDVARRWYHEEWEPTEYIQQKLVDDIARAILAERERCAKIAEAFRETTSEGRAELAAAIRDDQ